jgi:Ser/Thr protein kinase RdoA (MazF antagonist)
MGNDLPLDLAAQAVLHHYPLPRGPSLVALGNRGGFSGARLWRVGSPAGPLCLRAWPESSPGLDRLRVIHGWMEAARGAGLEFVPAVLRTATGACCVEHAGRLWDLTAWLPGRADFHDRPTPGRLEAACAALARLHAVWARLETRSGPCPAIHRRLDGVRAWTNLINSDWRPAFRDDGDPVHPWARRAWRVLQAHFPRLPALLAPWATVSLPLHPCLCDVWHDHVLFEGDGVSGLVDYGSVNRDHASADLARLLGSLVPDDPEQTAAGLEAYGRLRPLTPAEQALVGVLDQTGTVLGAANWLRQLYHEGRAFEDRAAVADRLALLVRRLESWPAPVSAHLL